ncbi:cytochrome d ubiquinol oxidase subunit II [Sporomusa acidovorans]|uniref:Cytochrome bd-I ubiquinol oxidase subunit 2 n=1 Tax=Sporomusa acidovorans (strain ATCC 49682 / DSM 3132 / Mol) TaxID=1123286 RepID=A0ABZ3IWN3_SPOA4|nr:cytochrome d ubiquinol oxidase subunit II [Sporomusa acidovorans]OZC17995.1 cytochrome bd-I ubiquinol oxidase subunit 2 [Sporomusa acidovorans DSM 3132]SDF42391.1 cytochrome bd-I ubiquinol oxidase subunit 2 apoprotein [Sporomusa acidovorans]
MELNVVWFILLTVLFIGFFFLEGFDYGVGILLPFLGKNDTERRVIINTIGPVWDGNEVWMITAGGAMFAAFPHVYATLFSGFYLALFLMLMALIVRGVAFEFRSKDQNPAWRSTWDWLIFIGSAIPAVLWGVAVTNLIQGVPIDANMQYVGTFFDLLSPYTLVGGVAFFLVFAFHGALYLTLKTEGDMVKRARKAALQLGVGTAVFCLALVGLTYTNTDLFASAGAGSALLGAVVLFVGAYGGAYCKRHGFSFILSSLTIAFTTIAFFWGLFPRLMVSNLNPAWSLTITNAASTPYTLSIMTVAALLLVPVVLVYQGWVYWIFRKRVNDKNLEY